VKHCKLLEIAKHSTQAAHGTVQCQVLAGT